MVAPMAARGSNGSRWQWVVIGGIAVLGTVCSIALAVLGWPLDLIFLPVTAYFLSYLVTGSIAWIRLPRNPVGPVMLATAVAGSLAFWTLHPEPLVWRTAGLAVSVAYILVAWIMLAAPTGRITRRSHWVALAAWSATVVAIALPIDRSLYQPLWATGLLLSLALAVLVLLRWVDASRPSRRWLAPVVAAGVLFCLVHAVNFAAGLLLMRGGPGTPIQVADSIARTLIPFGFLLGLLRLRMARGAVAELVVELGETPAPERLRDALAGALGDPSLEVVYWSPPFRTYIDTNGVPVDIATDTTGRAVTLLERDGQPLTAILHDPALAEDPGLVAAVGASVRLAVDNERLAAEVRSQLDEVQASRSRIVEASDAERRRVERNLHDGAQQRLVALSLALRRAQAQLPADAGPELTSTLEGASEQLKTALAELRELAKGIHPAILTEAGLGPALRSLARESPVPVTVRLEVPEGRADAVAVAAYFVAAEALANVAKYAGASRVELVAETERDQLRIEISDDGRGGADPAGGSGLRGLTDRVAALGGRLDVRSPVGGGTRVVATLPLAAGVEVET